MGALCYKYCTGLKSSVPLTFEYIDDIVMGGKKMAQRLKKTCIRYTQNPLNLMLSFVLTPHLIFVIEYGEKCPACGDTEHYKEQIFLNKIDKTQSVE